MASTLRDTQVLSNTMSRQDEQSLNRIENFNRCIVPSAVLRQHGVQTLSSGIISIDLGSVDGITLEISRGLVKHRLTARTS